jgi:hypothetical protein
MPISRSNPASPSRPDDHLILLSYPNYQPCNCSPACTKLLSIRQRFRHCQLAYPHSIIHTVSSPSASALELEGQSLDDVVGGFVDGGIYRPPVGGWNQVGNIPDWLDESDDDPFEQPDAAPLGVQNEDMEVEEEESEPDSNGSEDENRVTTSIEPPATIRK